MPAHGPFTPSTHPVGMGLGVGVGEAVGVGVAIHWEAAEVWQLYFATPPTKVQPELAGQTAGVSQPVPVLLQT